MEKLTEKPIVHLHIPKTAGTSLRHAFERTIGDPSRIYFNPNEREYVKDGNLTFENRQYDFVSGHIGFETASKIDGHIVTIVRYPVDRYISTYFFWRQLHETGVEISRNTQLATKFSLDEFVKIRDEPSIIEEFLDRTTWQIAFGSRIEQRMFLRARGVSDDQIYRDALENLNSFEIVGIQERLWTFSADLRDKFGINYEMEMENVTKNKKRRDEIRIGTLRNIYDWLEMDMDLYQHMLVSNFSAHP